MSRHSREAITSRQNPWFRRFLDAARNHEEELLLEGPKQIADARRAGWVPIAWVLGEEAEPPQGSVPAIRLTRALLRELTDSKTPQGVLALFERPESSLDSVLSAADPLLVVLDGIQDPGNVGTIVRLAVAFDATGVVVTEGTADPFSPKALRSSAGAALLVPIASTDRVSLIARLAERSIPLYAAAAGGEETVIRRPAALVLGSEGRGVSEEVALRAQSVGIRMSDRLDSLNVAAAAAILLHESYRQQRRS